MYSHNANGLGEAPATAEPSMWDSLTKVLSTGVSAGFNIYNKVQNLQLQKQQTKAVQSQVAMMQQVYGPAVYGQNVGYGQPLQPMYGQPQQGSFMDGWTMPLLLAGAAAVVGFVIMRKK